MYIKTTGLVLREAKYKESSRILTLLTSSEGKITASARGAKRKGSRTAASSQLLAYSDMTLFFDKGRYIVTEANSIELFTGLREDLKRFALGSYFAELLEMLSDEDIPNPEMLSLGLNALFVLSEGKKDPDMIKAAFELRLMCVAGFAPLLDGCAVCGNITDSAAFSLNGGVIYCAECAAGTAGEKISLLPGTLSAMRYIVSSDPKKLYSFTLDEKSEKQLERTAEAYLISQLGRDFYTLDFYKSLI